MALPEQVVVDTSAFYALLSATDAFHTRAAETYERLLDREVELWTTSYILVELTALAHRRLGFNALQTSMQTVQRFFKIYWVDQATHWAAWRQFTTSQGAGLSFVDCTTLLVAQRLQAHIFTFDKGFAAAGVPILPR